VADDSPPDDSAQEAPPASFFTREDESADEHFYQQPRFVEHIDQSTIDALTEYYRKVLRPGIDVLDLMSSWVSHLPEDLNLGRVSGLGMNGAELEANPRLSDWWVQNLNTTPELEAREAYDAVLCTVSIQYLVKPVEVMRAVHNTLRPLGTVHISMSHRCFPTKAIAAFQQLGPKERVQLVSYYLEEAGFDEVEFLDRSPDVGDPLWILTGRK